MHRTAARGADHHLRPNRPPPKPAPNSVAPSATPDQEKRPGVTRSAADLPARFRLTPGTVVLDDSMAEVQHIPGAVGKIAFTGGMPKGYYKDDVKTAANFVEINGKRHVIPGDLVRVEEDGYIELLGRGATVVNSGGEKVYPADVEESILRFPGVDDVAVFGIPDARWGEVVAAAIAVHDPERFPVTDLIADVGAELAATRSPAACSSCATSSAAAAARSIWAKLCGTHRRVGGVAVNQVCRAALR